MTDKEQKNKFGKPLNRPFAPNKRQTKEDMLKVKVEKKDS